MSIKKILKSTLKYPIELTASVLGEHRKNRSEPRLWIMMYHRILPPDDFRYANEEPGMIVEPETLAMHMEVLNKEFTIVQLSDWLSKRANNQPLPDKACAITFDDGWLDNYEYAFPILKERNIPATLFVVSNMADTNKEFWPNRLNYLLMNTEHIKLQKIDWLKDILPEVINKESVAYLINNLKQFPDLELIEKIEAVEKQLNIETYDDSQLMTWQQIKEVSDEGLIEIGSHTCNHIRLREGLEAEVYEQEIHDSKLQIEEKLEKEVKLFCYPNGDACDTAKQKVKENYLGAVLTKKGINHSTSIDNSTLLRIGVHQDISNNKRKLLARIANWP